MPIPIPSPLVEFLLLGPLDDRRQLQDSPILGDVWVEFGKEPPKRAKKFSEEPEPDKKSPQRLDLLIAPYRGQHAGTVAGAIEDGLKHDEDEANIAFLQGLIVARLTFQEVLEVVVPMTSWWLRRWVEEDETPKQNKEGEQPVGAPETKPRVSHKLEPYDQAKVKEILKTIIQRARDWHSKTVNQRIQEMPSLDRFMALTGLILWANSHEPLASAPAAPEDKIPFVLDEAENNVDGIASLMAGVVRHMLENAEPQRTLKNTERMPLVFQVSLNRHPVPALTKSISAVKADAAKFLFKVNCSEIGWAVIDSGIDGSHPAFKTADGKANRIKRSFDFKHFRKIVSLSNSKDKTRKTNLDILLQQKGLKEQPANPDEDLKKLAAAARMRGPIHWEIVEKFVEIKPDTPPSTNHGTHVAGIIGASKEATKLVGGENSDFADGMCPDITLYDFRVLGAEIRDTEFAIIAALQFIRYLNDRDNFLTIQGANLSLSIPHDVRNFACGRTPICDECERLVDSGVVVIAAAGNHGYKSFETREGSYDSYAAFSITDPGNADNVLTVGATHRFWPHTYGVSFFSSRGPTGDGRLKPDLVAPGERIRAPLPDGEWGDLDGTSMAAPHVSGAAAMLMARYSELIGQPRRIKRILCESATDLGRERSFQGHGMLDVLRAFQSI